MSWIDRLLPRIHKSDSEHSEKKESMIPEGLWTKCPSCEQVLYTEELRDSLMVCPKCSLCKKGTMTMPDTAERTNPANAARMSA